MKRTIVPILFLVMLIALAMPARSAQAAPVVPALSVEVRPRELAPAQAGYVFVSGGYPLQVSVTLDGKPLAVFWTGDGYLAPFAFGFDAPAGEHPVVVLASDPATGAQVTYTQTVSVTDFQYPREEVSIARRLAALLDPILNRNEEEWLNAVYAARSNSTDWGWPFALPVPGELITSKFGGDRTYNGGLWRAYHTGVDFRRAVGQPIWATASGRVVAVESLNVRGNVVIIDHGYGIFSQYAHTSEAYVTPGQYVQRGQLIAAAGATGRTNGPHLHFEIIVNGIPIDPLSWMALMPGFVPPAEVPRERNQPIEEGTGS